MGNLIYNSPQEIEKPDDLTIEECQEAFDMFRLQKAKKNKGYFDLIMTMATVANRGLWHICKLFFAMFRLLLANELPMDNSPVMMEKPNDLTHEQCQEAFAMAKAQKVRQCLDLIMKSHGLYHIREQIFGSLNYKTVANCREVSELWNESLERIALIKFIEEFADRDLEYTHQKVSTIIPGWQNAAKKYGVQASFEDLEEVKDSLEKLITGIGKCCSDPVHHAARNGSMKLIEFILGTSYNMNTKDNHRYTVLHWACIRGETETVNLLIQSSKDFKINLNAKYSSNRYGHTAWHLACSCGRTKTAQLIIKNSKDFGIDLNTKGIIGRTALHDACMNGQTETVLMILKNWKEFGIDIKAQDNDGRTALDLVNRRWDEKSNQIKKMLEKEYSQILNLE